LVSPWPDYRRLTTSPPGQTEGNMVKGLAKYRYCLRHGLLTKYVDANRFLRSEATPQ
jgi:hypothetical protein